MSVPIPERVWFMRRILIGRHFLVASLILAAFFFGGIAPSSRAFAEDRVVGGDSTAAVDSVLRQGMQFESQRQWGEALAHYEDALREFPSNPSLQERYATAKIHYDLGRRYSDVSFRKSIITLRKHDSLDMYGDVLLKIDSHYVHDVDWRQLVQGGNQSLTIAMQESVFAERYLRELPAERLDAFRGDFGDLTRVSEIRGRSDAIRFVENVSEIAERQLGVPPAAVVMEYIAGAAGGLDPYSSYLTGDQLREVYSQIDGNFVGLGIELKATGGSLLIVSVIPESPADRGGIRSGDRILTVDGTSTSGLSTDEAATLLQGIEGSLVEVEVISNDEAASRTLRLRRQHVEVPSVEGAKIIDASAGIAYLRLVTFQRTTPRDIDAALWKLHRQGMRSLIVDVRDNPGGLLTAAVDVADKFVRQGTIVSTRGRNKHEDFNYSAHDVATWPMPLVVLVDQNSASASEIFAAAIRDHGRGTIVGQRSYGKGSVQGIFPLNKAGAGIRLTTAKFYGPKGGPINQVGVAPDVVVRTAAKPVDPRLEEATQSSAQTGDATLEAATEILRRQVAQR